MSVGYKAFVAFRGLADRTTVFLMPTNVTPKEFNNPLIRRSGSDHEFTSEVKEPTFGVLGRRGLGYAAPLAGLTESLGVIGGAVTLVLGLFAEMLYVYSLKDYPDPYHIVHCTPGWAKTLDCKTCDGENTGICIKANYAGCKCNKKTRTSANEKQVCPIDIKCSDPKCGGDTKVRGLCNKMKSCPCCPSKPPDCTSKECVKGVVIATALLCKSGPYKGCLCQAYGTMICKHRKGSPLPAGKMNEIYQNRKKGYEQRQHRKNGKLEKCNRESAQHGGLHYSMTRDRAVEVIKTFCERQAQQGSMIYSPGDSPARRINQLSGTASNTVDANWASHIIMVGMLYRKDGSQCTSTQKPQKVDAKKCIHGLEGALDSCDTDSRQQKYGGEYIAECVLWSIGVGHAPTPPPPGKYGEITESATLYDGPNCSSGRISPLGWYTSNKLIHGSACHMVVGEGASSAEIWHGKSDWVIAVYPNNACSGDKYIYPSIRSQWYCISEKDTGWKIKGWRIKRWNNKEDQRNHGIPRNCNGQC